MALFPCFTMEASHRVLFRLTIAERDVGVQPHLFWDERRVFVPHPRRPLACLLLCSRWDAIVVKLFFPFLVGM